MPSIKWKLGDDILQPNESTVMFYDETTGDAILELYDTPVNNLNVYSVEAKNDLGIAVGTAEIFLEDNQVVVPKVLKAPRVTPLKAQVVPNKSTLTMEAYYSGIPEPEVKWLKNGKEVVIDSDVIVETGNGLTKITVHNMDRKRAGKYEVVAINEAGESRESGSVMVSDEPSPDELQAPWFIEPIQPLTVLLDDVVILEAIVQSNPPSSFQWFFQSMPVKVTPNVRMHSADNKSVLIIENFALENSGIYMCRAENVAGSVTSSATVKLVEAESYLEEIREYLSPRFVKKLKPGQFMDGDSMQLVCQVIGNPTPKIQWLHNKEPLSETRGISIQQDKDGVCKLNIPEVFPEDGGVFTCRAINKFGKAITKTNIIVEGTYPNTHSTYISLHLFISSILHNTHTHIHRVVSSGPSHPYTYQNFSSMG